MSTQMERVFNVLKVGGYFTLDEIADQTGDPQQAISARIRDLRKPKYGGHTIERKQFETSGKAWCYKMTVNEDGEVPRTQPRRKKPRPGDEAPRPRYRKGHLSFATDEDGMVSVVSDL